jgi:phenylpropionate dioxygenase-like ring-hydroxylating dioxygenase large terminal subunit
LVDLKSGKVSRRIFFDKEIYQEELRQVFSRCWLFLGHESQLPEPGDFITTYMGEDPVIVCRDLSGNLRAFLNSCRHRGMKICRLDGGNAREFICSFHGWSYGNDGKLQGVPYYREYGQDLDREALGLRAVPKVRSYGGFIFGCWDDGAPSLEDYLGELRWYFDVLIEGPVGGIQVLGGGQRYACGANWKIAAENFSGDTYHLPFSHKSLFLLENVRPFNPVGYEAAANLHTVTFPEVGHALTAIGTAEERYKADLALAREMGPEVVEYVEETRRRLIEHCSTEQARVYALAFGNIFPNFSFNNFSALRPIGLYLWLPKGPDGMEARQWCGVAKDAPQVVKEMIREDFTRIQSAVGIVAQDDTENFEQVTEATKGDIGQQLDFIYAMGLSTDEGEAHPPYPGRFHPYFSESGQRTFYGHWARAMGGAS